MLYRFDAAIYDRYSFLNGHLLVLHTYVYIFKIIN